MPTDALPPPPDRPAIAQALLDLAAPPQPPFDEDAERRRAERLAAAGVDALGAGAAAVLIVDDEGAPLIPAGSGEGALALAGVEAGAAGGPALECCRSGRAQVVEVASVRDLWRPWAEVAERAGWTLAQAVPLRAAGRTVGGMVLLTGSGRRLPDAEVVWAGVLAAVAASAVLGLRTLRDLQRRADQLQAALVTRVVIEQAKGVLAERGGLDVATAFERLRRYARAHRERLADVARDVVSGDAADAVLTHVRPLRRPGSILEE